MIFSMTAYAQTEQKLDKGTFNWEIRSVNQRFLETLIRLPESYRFLEPLIRDQLRKKVQRGKLELQLKFSSNSDQHLPQRMDQQLAKHVIDQAKWVQSIAQCGAINPVEILKWPGVMEYVETDSTAIQSQLVIGFEQLLQDFLQARSNEGDNLKALLVQRLNAITDQIDLVNAQLPEALNWQRQRLIQRLAEIKSELDPQRLEQEMVILAQKSDVAEELDRLHSHVKETHKILNTGGPCGRRLDFMMQEFNREANTLGSKSICTEITNASIELKVLIEQMREQIQNIE